MNNLNFLAIQEFRRFVNLHIYPELVSIYIMPKIVEAFNVDMVHFEPLPQPIIKFNYGLPINNDNSYTITEKSHIILKGIFIDFFNNPDVIKVFRNKIYVNIEDDELKYNLNKILSEIQIGNVRYVSLLFNITFLKDNNIYLYL